MAACPRLSTWVGAITGSNPRSTRPLPLSRARHNLTTKRTFGIVARKLPSLQYVKFVRSKGNVYGYFDTGKKDAKGKRIYAPLGRHSSTGFADRYTTLLGHRNRATSALATVNDIADRYDASAELAALAVNTQRFYRAQMKHIRRELGDFPLSQVKRRHIAEVVNNRLGEKNGTRNGFLAVYGVLHSYAVSQDLIDGDSPTKTIKQFKTGEHHPWPEQLLVAGLQAGHDRTRLAIALLYYTGQRIGDAVRFRWNWIVDGRLRFTQEKTGKAMDIPIHRSLRAELDRAPKSGLTILASYEGKPMTPQVIRRELKEFGAAHDEIVVPHGLRKNAVNALLEAGCTPSQTAAITGQSLRMVEYYAREVSQKALGTAAILQWERNGNVQTDVQTS